MNLTRNDAYESAPKTMKDLKNVDISWTSRKKYLHSYKKDSRMLREFHSCSHNGIEPAAGLNVLSHVIMWPWD